MDGLCRAYEAQIDSVDADRAVTAIINTGDVDRYATVIDPAGVDLTAYRKNPVVLWEHGKDPTRGRLPIGRNLWIKRSGSRLIAKTQFGKDDYSQALFELYRDGVLRGWSIFALPDMTRAGKPTPAEIRARPDLERCETIYRACELGEYSGVAVPGNAETLTMLESRSIWFPEVYRTEVCNPPPQVARDEDDTENEAQHSEPDADDEPAAEPRYVEKVGDQWGVFSESGKLLGKHPTEAAAKKQLAAVEANKHDPARAAAVVPPAAVPGRSYRDIDAQWMAEFRVLSGQLMTHVRDLADLMRGRV